MNHLQPEHIRELEDFKSATQGELWKLDNNNNNNNNSSSRSSGNHLRRRIPADNDRHSSSRISSSTACSTRNNNNNNGNNKIITVHRKSSWINDPEVKRQRRIAKYKAYAVEGKMKSSFRNGFRWVKNKYCQLVHGY
ncbi:DUF3511 domain protein, putative (DUF3511) [Melia azedarach]|uniref:DUF3511 domain protein, putative (DUF3511) n=1 Tax=Melia azedarach TaxID=155640 RepID=A0ACC1YF80_MELAZ|nr:DUF3511 domain protein, putative (DUF3511) [Melia azedarach]